ncbi:MAG: hypothetical protein LJE69_05235 [Thiohalocapsa sp.]|jgi:hypothetical protein|uniref:hypothetical protein n=1 Tax=Thiohalocapsa sp. TaxID=2497641 RepID=UPI0025E5E7E8|nr:hypothetical protein [Thiohalocapsa sp.]MCG6940636.1 hypothetical protein [Thiohalocapsa sp.]
MMLRSALRARFDAAWLWLLRRARLHPWISGVAVVTAVLGLSAWVGWLLNGLGEDSPVAWLDKAFTVLGALSLALGWAVALPLYAARQELAQSYRRAGVPMQGAGFRAALIMAGPEPLMQWHLCQMRYARAELVWTERTRAAAGAVLARFPETRCLHGPGDVNEECLADAFDLPTIKAHCRQLLAEMLARFRPEEICVDVTSGTAVMSVGAFQVAEELGVTSIYLVGTHRSGSGQPQIRAGHEADADEGQVIILSDHRPGNHTTGRQGDGGRGTR